MGAQRESDLLRRRQPLGDRVERTVEGGGTLAHRLVEKLLLRGDVVVERPFLHAHRSGEVAHRGAVKALFGEEPGCLPGQLGTAGGHGTVA